MRFKKLNIKDNITFSSREETEEGYLRGVATITSVGVQQYLGSELGVEGVDPNRTYGVFRSPEVVFSDITINSARLKPVTDEHPLEGVDAGNYCSHAVGHLGDSYEIVDGTSLAFPIIITNESAKAKVLAGAAQLSCGYLCDVQQDEGVYNGIPYQFKYIDGMVINHVALTESGRCGDAARILDAKNGDKKMLEKKSAEKKVDAKQKKDIDMGNLVQAVAEKILPDVKKIISGDDFVNRLAQVMGNALAVPDPDDEANEVEMSAGDQGENAGAEVESDVPEAVDADPYPEGDRVDADEMKCAPTDRKDSAVKKLKNKMLQVANTRADIIVKAKMIDNNIKTDSLSNRAILLATLKDSYGNEVKNKSTEYLSALVDTLVKHRKDAGNYLVSISGENNAAKNGDVERNALELRNTFRLLES